ncbi:uncharacterized protein LOC144096820 [Amblyomma americanum]
MVLLKMYMDGFTYSHISEAATAPISTQYTSFKLNELFITFPDILTEYKVCYRCYKRTNFWHWTSSTCVIVSTQTETVPEFSLWRYLGTRELADVEIVVHWEHAPEQHASFKAHRMILALQNVVFRAMFFGHFAREDRLTIMDMHPDGVEGLLR